MKDPFSLIFKLWIDTIFCAVMVPKALLVLCIIHVLGTIVLVHNRLSHIESKVYNELKKRLNCVILIGHLVGTEDSGCHIHTRTWHCAQI